MNRMLGIGIVAIFAVMMLIGTTYAGTSDGFAKTRHDGSGKKYDQSGAQSIGTNIECPSNTEVIQDLELTNTGGSGDHGDQTASTSQEQTAGELTSSTYCAVTNLMNQGDTAALVAGYP